MTSPAYPTSLPEDTANAIQDALGAEHAALWVYGLVSAFLPDDFDSALAEGANAHRARRDATELLLSGAGQNPRSAEPAYVATGAGDRPGVRDRGDGAGGDGRDGRVACGAGAHGRQGTAGHRRSPR